MNQNKLKSCPICGSVDVEELSFPSDCRMLCGICESRITDAAISWNKLYRELNGNNNEKI